MNMCGEGCRERDAQTSAGAGRLEFLQLTLAEWRAAAAWHDRVLGVASIDAPAETASGVPHLTVHTPVLAAGLGPLEVWRAGKATRGGRRGHVQYRCDDDLLFGAISLPEVDFPVGGAPASEGFPDTALRRATESAYRQLFALLDGLEFPHLLRIWNYLPAINVVTDGLERYRQFNIGRQDAFLACARPHTVGAPAACALGSARGDLCVYFLAGRQPVQAIENPRQISAYAYPNRYGPRAPTFSRAALARLPGQEVLFISGTASIVGHQTLHIGDVAGQTRETLTNIAAVLAEANRVAQKPFGAEDLLCKVYVRHPEDYASVRRVFEEKLSPRVPPVYVQADICRDDLLVEVEATAFSALAR